MKTEVLILALIVFALGSSVVFTAKDANDWATFSKEHNCKVVERDKGSVAYSFGGVNGKPGQFMTYQPDTTVYLCDDGVRYSR